MKDILFMNNETGELLPSTEAIKDFYKSHNILEAWTDLWTETKLEAENDLIFPDFTKVF